MMRQSCVKSVPKAYRVLYLLSAALSGTFIETCAVFFLNKISMKGAECLEFLLDYIYQKCCVPAVHL